MIGSDHPAMQLGRLVEEHLRLLEAALLGDVVGEVCEQDRDVRVLRAFQLALQVERLAIEGLAPRSGPPGLERRREVVQALRHERMLRAVGAAADAQGLALRRLRAIPVPLLQERSPEADERVGHRGMPVAERPAPDSARAWCCSAAAA